MSAHIIPQDTSVSSRMYKGVIAFIVAAPIVSLLLLVWFRFGNWLTVMWVVIFYFMIAPGVTVGLHRYFTHRSFEASLPLKVIMCFAAIITLEGKITTWVANHMWHHQHSDVVGVDLHTPLEQEGIRGLLYAHVWWMFPGRNADPKLASHLTYDRVVQFFDRQVLAFFLGRALLPGLVCGLVGYVQTQSIQVGTLWGIEATGWSFVLVGMVHHFTWCINSICHVWGEQPYRTSDNSRNVWWLWVVTLGESWHNTHHAFPRSSLQGSAWWNDPSYCIIKMLEWVKLAYDVDRYVPTQNRRDAKRKSVMT